MESTRMERLLTAIVAGRSQDSVGGLKDAKERTFWDNVTRQVAEAIAAGYVIDIPNEIPDVHDSGLRVKDQPMPASKAISTFEVSKSITEERFTLGPMYVPNRLDAHAEWTDAEELQKAVWDYVKGGDRRIRLQHDRDKVAGEWVEVMTWPYEVEVPMLRKDSTSAPVTFPAGTVFLGVKWEPWAWQMVKSDAIRGYSIGGRAERLYVDLEDSMAKAEGACPLATRDIATNLKHREKAIKVAAYGPLNPDEPNASFWKAKADRWNVTITDAQKSTCGNCAMFIRTKKMLDCIETGLAAGDAPGTGWDSVNAGRLGYCEAFDFKCASSRSCDAWVTGGPVTDNSEE